VVGDEVAELGGLESELVGVQLEQSQVRVGDFFDHKGSPLASDSAIIDS